MLFVPLFQSWGQRTLASDRSSTAWTTPRQPTQSVLRSRVGTVSPTCTPPPSPQRCLRTRRPPPNLRFHDAHPVQPPRDLCLPHFDGVGIHELRVGIFLYQGEEASYRRRGGIGNGWHRGNARVRPLALCTNQAAVRGLPRAVRAYRQRCRRRVGRDQHGGHDGTDRERVVC